MTPIGALIRIHGSTVLGGLGVLLWLVYGLAIVDGPLIGSSVVTLAITSIILVLKIRHG